MHLATLHHAAATHDQDLVGQRRDHAHVMRDQRQCHAAFGDQLAQQRENLRLHRHVERGGRFVGDQQLWFAGQRHGDHGALAHAARELVRILRQSPRHVVDAHLVEQLRGTRARRLPAQSAMRHQRFGDLVADGQMRRERAQRILEDHRHLRPRSAAPAPASSERPPSRALPVIRARVRQKVHQGEKGLGLAGAGFADDAEAAPGPERERQVVDGRHRAVGNAQVFDLQHRLSHRRRPTAAAVRRRAS